MRRVLFISYNFPPHGGPGVQRSIKFVKYLPQAGWDPIVVTSSEDASTLRDSSLVRDLDSGTMIVRVKAWSMGSVFRLAQRLRMHSLAAALNTLLALPDAAMFWARKARQVAQVVIEKNRPDAIYSTSGPYSCHLLGEWLRQRHSIPWFADFRDPWSSNLLVRYPPGYRFLNRRLERSVLNSADKVACVSRPWLDDLAENCPGSKGKFVVLANGYDEDDISALPTGTPKKPFTISYFGSFLPNRRPDAFIKAVGSLLSSGALVAEHIRLLFVGSGMSRHITASAPYEIHDYLPHAELEELRGATDVFLLILATDKRNSGNYSGKIYEYLASNRPILGIVPGGGVAESLIAETRTGVTVGPDSDEISRAIMKLYDNWRTGTTEWNPDWTAIRQYSRKNLTAQLASHLETMVSEMDSG